MSERTLFLAWQDKEHSRQWFPIGRLDADRALSRYRFRYTGGALRAQEEANISRPFRIFPRWKRSTSPRNCFTCSKTGS